MTIEARRERAKELVDAGMSQRQAAAVLGVDAATVNRDLAALQNATESVAGCNTETAEIAEPTKPIHLPAREEKRKTIVRKNEALANSKGPCNSSLV